MESHHSGGHKLVKQSTSGSMSGRPRGSTRSTSKGGGMQVTLGETGNWSDLTRNNTTLPADAGAGKGQKPSGMLGFFKKGGARARSPKPREPGVLGKEGARVIISNGR
jgi:serine/threonine kinase 32